MKLVELKEFTVRSEAELILNLLHEHGIRALLRSDDLGGLTPSLGIINGYQIMVEESQLDEAGNLIK